MNRHDRAHLLLVLAIVLLAIATVVNSQAILQR